MIAEYTVKRNGKWYHAGDEIDEGADESAPLPFDEPVKHTKTEIMRMSTADLQALATMEGIEDADKINGAELKKLLIDKFDL